MVNISKVVRAGVGAVTVNNSEVLIIKRGPKSQSEIGKWGFPGGGIEFGETAREAIAREIKEELNIDIKVEKQLLSVDHILAQEKQHWVAVPFVCTVIRGELKILETDKISDFKWVNVPDLRNYDLTIVAEKLLPQVMHELS